MKMILAPIFIACLLVVPANAAPPKSYQNAKRSVKARGEEDQQKIYLKFDNETGFEIRLSIESYYYDGKGIKIRNFYDPTLRGRANGRIDLPVNTTCVSLKAYYRHHGFWDMFWITGAITTPPSKMIQIIHSNNRQKGIINNVK
jgi:hypothetical protein